MSEGHGFIRRETSSAIGLVFEFTLVVSQKVFARFRHRAFTKP